MGLSLGRDYTCQATKPSSPHARPLQGHYNLKALKSSTTCRYSLLRSSKLAETEVGAGRSHRPMVMV